ncbi:hypothetical protein ACFYUV_42325 [Nonomuraea sp. NPDC003560]|uniref:hypothetical protein n=1 Tax=Nonomuraea sp. NPDC003560 TaxID=3364341 RepID=UPI00368AB5CD
MNFTRASAAALKNAELSGFHFHDLRHTGTTLGIEPELSAWEWATDLAVLSGGNGEAGQGWSSGRESLQLTVDHRPFWHASGMQ